MTEKWCMLTDDYGEWVADKSSIIDILREYGAEPEISDTEILCDGQTIALPITTENASYLMGIAGEDNELYASITEAYRGKSLSDYPILSWSEHWPVIDRDRNLTGEAVDSDVMGWSNYSDLAAIFNDEATAGGWEIDKNEGYAYPPKPYVEEEE